MDDLASFFKKKASSLKKEKKFEDAIEFENKAHQVQNDEKSPDFWYKRAMRFCEIGEYEQALDCIDNDLTQHGKSYDSFFIKGLILFRLTEYAESIECFNKASEERNQNYLQSSQKIHHMKKAKKFEKAIQYADIANNEKPLDEIFWYHKALSFLKLQKYDSAASCLDNALKLNKDDPKFLYALAKCKILSGDVEEGLNTLEISCSLQPVYREKLNVDADLEFLSNNKKFRAILGL